MNLQLLLQGVDFTGDPDSREIRSVAFDSRKAEPMGLFVAMKGTRTDGHDHIDDAVEKGCTAVLCERLPEYRPEGVLFVQTPDTAEALGIVACNFYGNPSGELSLVGITGTNGKTTTATLLYRLFSSMGERCGLLSTVENRIGADVYPATHTTPDPLELNRLLRKMVDEGCGHAFMEVSSHALDQRRVAGIRFAGGVFSNITHDHLDYHKTFRNYLHAKKRLFDDLPESAFALTNLDDKNGQVMLQNTPAKRYAYALKKPADFKGRILENNASGLVLDVDGREFHARLVGEFNAYNLLAVYATAVLLGQAPVEVLTHLSRLSPAEGRFDCVFSPDRKIMGIVDYAHTPDALEKVLQTALNIRQPGGRIIVLAGCGGDRDRAKRPQMARIAARYADLAILTSDNPRSENPEDILAEMQAGLTPDLQRKALKISDRSEAIHAAARMARPGDILLVAGKGHEKYQEIKGVKHPFDDMATLVEALQIHRP
jgi:UDP-N-acetylmuramoyl-L-alanyl-D-glutamate--2,6-diaminopimelate ligase